MLWVALEYFQNPKFHIPSSKIEWTTAIWRFELQKVKVLRKWHCRTATAVASATGVRISNGLFRMICMIHKHHLKPWNHIQKIFPVPLLTDWLVEGHLSGLPIWNIWPIFDPLHPRKWMIPYGLFLIWPLFKCSELHKNQPFSNTVQFLSAPYQTKKERTQM